MDIGVLRFVVGEAKRDKEATIRLYGAINEENTSRFNEEFLYLESVVKPSKIRVSINSEGGSVLFGMGTYSIIQNSEIDTECVIEGIAASMASVIWCAGKVSLMRDYSILMIHNPFCKGVDRTDEVVRAFQKQIETVYCRRLGLTNDRVREIMSGENDNKGTFFDAKGAVTAGIIDKGHILRTPKQMYDRVKSELEDAGNDVSKIVAVMANLPLEIPSEKESKPDFEKDSNLIQKTMEKNENVALGAVAASLGFSESANVTETEIVSRINSLTIVESKLKETEKTINNLKIEATGKDAKITNLEKTLKETTDQLNVYREAEFTARKPEHLCMIEDAIDKGKIDVDTKSEWLEMADKNPTLTKATLDSIPERVKISDEIANDPANVNSAKDALKDVDALLAEQVSTVVGGDFEFKRID